MMKKDEISHLQKDNKQFLDEEKERLQSECDQEIAEVILIRLNHTYLYHNNLHCMTVLRI